MYLIEYARFLDEELPVRSKFCAAHPVHPLCSPVNEINVNADLG
jgi:hypothetical protein